MRACFVLVRCARHDRLFAEKLRGTRRDRAPLQELRPLVPADRPCERGVLRAPREVRRAALPRDRRIPSVDKKADRRPHLQGVSQGVQKALRVDQSRTHHRRAVLRMERESQRRKEEMRPRDHLAGGIPAVAPRLENMKLRGRQLADRVFFVYSGAESAPCLYAIFLSCSPIVCIIKKFLI